MSAYLKLVFFNLVSRSIELHRNIMLMYQKTPPYSRNFHFTLVTEYFMEISVNSSAQTRAQEFLLTNTTGGTVLFATLTELKSVFKLIS